MKLSHAVLAATLALGAGQAMACYQVFDRNNQVVYSGEKPPVDMSRPLHETLPARFPGGHLVFAGDRDCPTQGRLRVASTTGRSPLLVDIRTAKIDGRALHRHGQWRGDGPRAARFHARRRQPRRVRACRATTPTRMGASRGTATARRETRGQPLTEALAQVARAGQPEAPGHVHRLADADARAARPRPASLRPRSTRNGCRSSRCPFSACVMPSACPSAPGPRAQQALLVQSAPLAHHVQAVGRLAARGSAPRRRGLPRGRRSSGTSGCRTSGRRTRARAARTSTWLRGVGPEKLCEAGSSRS